MASRRSCCIPGVSQAYCSGWMPPISALMYAECLRSSRIGSNGRFPASHSSRRRYRVCATTAIFTQFRMFEKAYSDGLWSAAFMLVGLAL